MAKTGLTYHQSTFTHRIFGGKIASAPIQFRKSPPRPSAISIQQSGGPKSSDNLCTVQGIVLGRAGNCSAEARQSAKLIQQSEGPESSDDLCTSQGVLLGIAWNCSPEARLDCRRNLFSRVEAPNRLPTYVPAKASYLLEYGTVPQKPAQTVGEIHLADQRPTNPVTTNDRPRRCEIAASYFATTYNGLVGILSPPLHLIPIMPVPTLPLPILPLPLTSSHPSPPLRWQPTLPLLTLPQPELPLSILPLPLPFSHSSPHSHQLPILPLPTLPISTLPLPTVDQLAKYNLNLYYIIYLSTWPLCTLQVPKLPLTTVDQWEKYHLFYISYLYCHYIQCQKFWYFRK